MTNKVLNLDFSKNPIMPPIIYGRVGDGEMQTITVKISRRDEIADLTGGLLTFEGVTKGGATKVFDSDNISTTAEGLKKGTFDYTFPNAAFAVEGKYERAYFSFVKDGKRDTTSSFEIIVFGNADIDAEEAETIIAEYNKLIEQLHELYQQTIDKVTGEYDQFHQQITKKMNEMETVIQNANADLTALKTKVDEIKQIIENLDNLSVMYSNSIDFGDYDYSGNPNLMPYITDPWVGSLLANGDTVKDSDKRVITHTKTRTADAGDILSLGLGIPRTAEANNRYLITALRPSTPYALTVTMSVGSDWTGETNTIGARVRYLNESGGTELPINVLLPANVERDKMITHTFTGTTKANLTGMTNYYVQIFSVNSEDKGTVSVSYDVKLEIGTIATPYQPNLLNAPYYLSKVALGENLIKPESQQPVTNSNYLIKTYNTKPMIKGKKYTITLEGTKPTTQTFRPFFTRATGSPWSVGDLQPVEGLTDVWSKTFTAADDAHPTSPQVQIYQVPNTSVGQCTIKWLKLEEGDTRTPNISEYKYFGEGLKDSNNPNDYSWDVTPEYTEKGLNNTVSLTEPQSVEGLKNFEDGLQIAGKEVATVPEDTGWVNLTAINGHSWNKQGQIRRIGKLVMFRGSLKGSTLSTQDFCTIPEGFRPSNPTDNYEYQFLLPPQSSNTLDNGGMAYIRPNGVCGLPSFRGTVNLFLAPIQYYID